MKGFCLVCNAHIDPVWLWEWEEGAAATISTFRTAAELSFAPFEVKTLIADAEKGILDEAGLLDEL